jgi:type IV secretion system protein VirD4
MLQEFFQLLQTLAKPKQRPDRPAPFLAMILAGACLYGAWRLWPPGGYDGDPGPWLVAGGLGFVGTLFAIDALTHLDILTTRLTAWRRAQQVSDVFGTAALAKLHDCAKAGLFDPGGLYLGLLKGRPLFYRGKAHLLTVAPARQGKGVNVVIPNLLHFQGSVLVTDPKGELAGTTARHRAERFGQDVLILNPWGLHGLPRHRYNPLQRLLDLVTDPDRARGVADEAKAIALQLLPEPEGEKNKYFRDGARRILRALMLHLATSGQPERCTLPEMWRFLNNRRRLDEAVAEMAGSRALGGMVADLGEDLSHKIADNPEQFEDFLTSAQEAVDIFDPHGELGEAVSASDFAFEDLKRKPMTVYLVIDQAKIASHGQWLGLISRAGIDAVSRTDGRQEVLFLLDEFQNMGKLAGLSEALTALPGKGVRLWAFVQEMADVVRIYGRETAQTLLSQAEVQQFFAVQSAQLRDQLSRQLGTRTVKTRNYSLGREMNADVSESLGETGRPLMSPEDIRLMGRDEQLLLIREVPPILARRIPFWSVSPWRRWADPNPVEGKAPRARTRLRIDYRRRFPSFGFGRRSSERFRPVVKGGLLALPRLPLPRLGPILRAFGALLWWIVKPRKRLWLFGTAAVLIALYGTPAILFNYTCRDRSCTVFTACSYIGLYGHRPRTPDYGRCDFVIVEPLETERIEGWLRQMLPTRA